MKNLIIYSLLCFVTLQLQAQCYEDRHSTSWYDAWVSCELKANPNPENPESHWIMYNFGQPYKLLDSKVWNINDPAHLDYGFRTVKVEYSLDGVEWINHGKFTFEQGMGESRYEGFEGPNLEGVDAQFLLLTAIDNYGGNCYGFGEIKINVEASTVSTNNLDRINTCVQVKAFPNPFTESATIEVKSQCNENVLYSIRDIFGKVIEEGNLGSGNLNSRRSFGSPNLPSGQYIIQINQGEHSLYHKILKQ
ncbi:MAG: T9SS type A sorting domain-containing protein [Bacteroidota bacterium]